MKRGIMINRTYQNGIVIECHVRRLRVISKIPVRHRNYDGSANLVTFAILDQGMLRVLQTQCYSRGETVIAG